MKKGTWSFFDLDGQFLGRTYSGPEKALAENTPEGSVAFPGNYLQLREMANAGDVSAQQSLYEIGQSAIGTLQDLQSSSEQ